MIISHKYKFIFIKTRKTAGSTIEYNLSSFLGPNDVITPLDGIPNANDHMGKNYILENNISKFFKKYNFLYLSKIFRKEFTTHHHAIKIKNIVGDDIWKKYFKFCVEREPLDKCLSYYFMRKNSLSSSYKRKNMSWSDFIKKGRFPVDYKFYTHQKKLIVDKIIKFEKLNTELPDLLNSLNLKGVKLSKVINNTYREKIDFNISNQDKKIIYKAFQKTLPFTGYNFNIG